MRISDWSSDVCSSDLRDVCYLHGFVERRGGDNSTERFISYFADDPTREAEGQAFAQAWAYMQKAQPSVIYYYSKYERTIYRKLRTKYAHVCAERSEERRVGKECVVRVDLGGRRIIKKKKQGTRRTQRRNQVTL